MRRWSVGAVTVVLAFLGLTLPAQAVELAGNMNIAGSVTVTASTIDWFPNGGTNGIFTVEPPATGYFADPGNLGTPIYVPFPTTTGLSLDLNSAIDPPGAPINVPNFLSGFTSANTEYNDLNFDLKLIQLASGAPACTGANIAVGTSCTLGAFLITQTASDALTVSLNLNGIFNDPSLGISSLLALGSYSTQGALTGAHIATIGTVSQLFTEIFTDHGSISASYSASFTAPPAVPEPATLVLLGTGLLGAGFGRRRWAKKNK